MKYVFVEELLMAMEKVKQELESMKAKLSSTQQSLAEKETHLTNLRAERRKHLEEVLEMKSHGVFSITPPRPLPPVFCRVIVLTVCRSSFPGRRAASALG
ncbi:hypothetical protein CB1_000286014 [Camelus ferus]|nr:hypothetical protein CB1_000286014 [Camelus ferus]